MFGLLVVVETLEGTDEVGLGVVVNLVEYSAMGGRGDQLKFLSKKMPPKLSHFMPGLNLYWI